jgi:SAM-dependent methyltransferase
MEKRLSRKPEYTFLDNLNNGRHGWLRLTPAYSARLVEERLQLYPNSLRVLDPFCGTGTTLLIAGYKGFEATGVEINPFLVWLSRTKTRIYFAEQIAQARNVAHCSVEMRSQIQRTEIDVPSIRDIDRWWDADSLRWLATMKKAIEASTSHDTPASDLLWIAFVRCVIGFSNASYHHPSLSFRKQAQLNLNFCDYDTFMMQELELVLQGAWQNPSREARILNGDARTLDRLPADTYDLVITSPPYVNRVSYIRELRPYMYWLGYLNKGRDAGELDWQAIGGTWGIATSRLKQWQPQLPVCPQVAEIANRIHTAHPLNGMLMANYALKYFEDMRLHINSLTRVLRKGARIHYIVGNSSFYGILVPAERILARFFQESGFEEVKVLPLRKRNCKQELFEYEITGVYTGI